MGSAMSHPAPRCFMRTPAPALLRSPCLGALLATLLLVPGAATAAESGTAGDSQAAPDLASTRWAATGVTSPHSAVVTAAQSVHVSLATGDRAAAYGSTE